jgi:hypothetical protein
MNERKNDKSLEELIWRTVGGKILEFDFDRWKASHREEIEDFSMRRRRISTSAVYHDMWRTIMKSRIAKLTAAAVIIFGVFVVMNSTGAPDLANTAWAQVTRQVSDVDYVHCYYFKSRGNSFIRDFEAWYGYGKLVILGKMGDMAYDDGQRQQTFDAEKRRTAQSPSFFAKGQTFFEVFSAGLLSDENEQFSQQMPERVGDDFLIYAFDPPADDADFLESIFITVGRNSLLPIQMKVYHKDSDYDLIIFDYEALEKPAEFFEPPMAASANGGGEVALDGEEVLFDIEGAPGIKQAIVRLHSKYDGPVDEFPLDYMRSDRHDPEFYRAVSKTVRKRYKKEGGPIFRLDVSFVTDEGYRSNINDSIALGLNEAEQCGLGKDWPDGKYRNIRFSPLLKSSDREDIYIVEISCWLRTKKD